MVLKSKPGVLTTLIAHTKRFAQAIASALPSEESLLLEKILTRVRIVLDTWTVRQAYAASQPVFEETVKCADELMLLGLDSNIKAKPESTEIETESKFAKAIKTIVSSKESKAFKKAIKIWTAIEDDPKEIVDKVRATSPDQTVDLQILGVQELEVKYSEVVAGPKRSSVKELAASMAIAQGSHRDLKDCEDRDVLLQQAAKYVVDTGAAALLPLHVRALLNPSPKALATIMKAIKGTAKSSTSAETSK